MRKATPLGSTRMTRACAPFASAPQVPALCADLARIAADLAGTGLALRVVGPWPAYAYARAALADG